MNVVAHHIGVVGRACIEVRNYLRAGSDKVDFLQTRPSFDVPYRITIASVPNSTSTRRGGSRNDGSWLARREVHLILRVCISGRSDKEHFATACIGDGIAEAIDANRKL